MPVLCHRCTGQEVSTLHVHCMMLSCVVACGLTQSQQALHRRGLCQCLEVRLRHDKASHRKMMSTNRHNACIDSNPKAVAAAPPALRPEQLSSEQAKRCASPILTSVGFALRLEPSTSHWRSCANVPGRYINSALQDGSSSLLAAGECSFSGLPEFRAQGVSRQALGIRECIE